MDQYDHKYFSVQKPSQNSSGPYISPPPTIGYPTRDKVVGDPPAAEVETKSNCCGSNCCDSDRCQGVLHILNCICACCYCLVLCGAGLSG